MGFVLFFSKITFCWKLFSDCWDKADYPGSIVYSSCLSIESEAFYSLRRSFILPSTPEKPWPLWSHQLCMSWEDRTKVLMFSRQGNEYQVYFRCPHNLVWSPKYLGLLFDNWSNCWIPHNLGLRFFFKNRALSVFLYYCSLSLCNKLIKLLEGLWTSGATDRQASLPQLNHLSKKVGLSTFLSKRNTYYSCVI